MIRLASVIDTFEAEFLAQYRDRLTSEHYRALAAIKQCRTHASPKMQVQCTTCEHQILVPHSCGHRHCPHCQHHESQQWLERQMKRLVPSEYFLITFTLPAEFRGLSWAQQRVLYDLLMRCSWETVRTFTQNDQQLQGTPGAIAVLHTHTRGLDYHPQVHLVMPAGALDSERKQWRSKRRRQGKGGYLFNHKARWPRCSGRSCWGRSMPPDCGCLAAIRRQWVVDCKSVGSGEKALIYLGRYLYRGVIREKDILACNQGQVSFRYRNAKTGGMERRTVPGAQFLWRVLQHVLPKGFRRARNFGFLHPNCKRLIALLHLLLKFDPGRALAWIKERPAILCSGCGAVMKIVKTRIRPWLPQATPPPLAAQEIH